MMSVLELFSAPDHRNILLEDFGTGAAVQANQHLIVHGDSAMILDPGGHRLYSRVLSQTIQQLDGARLEIVFLSHQDPDVVAATNGWLMTTDAVAYASTLWHRFIPHFGLDHLLSTRMREIPDEGMFLDVGGCELMVLPAHFMHSCGNFQVYDPISKILYTGDLGASLGPDYRVVTDFDAHVETMEWFHQRYMASNKVLRAWARMVRQLDVEIIAPQHGACFQGRAMVERFIGWAESLQCGLDLMDHTFELPEH